ncbi:MAG: D-alanine--D-alanine ligase [Gammaproteobacteria bacterium]
MTESGRIVELGKVAVLMGGQSAEREISLKSGNAVYQALRRRGVDAHALDVDAGIIDKLSTGNFNRAFIMLHGRGGEDGVIQGVLETMGISYTGSGVLGSALGMDKLRSKMIWQSEGLPTPDYSVIHGQDDFDKTVAKIGFPFVIKPVNEGSSIGMSKVTGAEEFPSAYERAVQYDCVVMAEKWIEGAEYTTAILGDAALPMICIKTPRTFYDYEAKYNSNKTNYICPCGLDAVFEEKLKTLSLQAFQSVGCSGWGRVDMMLDKDQQPWLIEVNTVPGMTDHSLVPMAAKAAGIDFDELVLQILETKSRVRVSLN